MTIARVGQEIVDGQGRLNHYGWALFTQASPNPDQAVAAQAVGASPFTYLNASGYALTAVVQGGTVSDIALGRGGAFTTCAGATGAQVLLSPGDSVRLTYSVLPTLNLIPR